MTDPDIPAGVLADYQRGIERGAEELAREIDLEVLRIALREKTLGVTEAGGKNFSFIGIPPRK